MQSQTPKEAEGIPAKELKRIRTAFWIAIVIVCINVGARLLVAGESPLTGTVVGLAEYLVMLALAIHLLRKQSRIAAVAIFVLFLAEKLLMMLPPAGAITDAQFDAYVSLVGRQLFWTALIGYGLLQGVLGAFAYQRSLRVGTTA